MKNCITISTLLMGIVLAVKLSEAQHYFGTCDCCQYCNSGSGVSYGFGNGDDWSVWGGSGGSGVWSGIGNGNRWNGRSRWSGIDDWGDNEIVSRRGGRGESEVRGGSGNRASGGGGGGAVPNAEMQKVLDKHNEVRRKLANGQIPGQPPSDPMPDLVWDTELAAKAQARTNSCIYKHDTNEDLETTQFEYVGQNIAESKSLERNLENWINEYRNYNYGTNRCRARETCGHYTQMVWAKSTHLGCGKNVCKRGIFDQVYLVCNYGPAGNVQGQKPYRVS